MRPLSPRLKLILELGLADHDFWDVCCDHGYLGEHALASGRFHKVYFVDQVPHIISSIQMRLGTGEPSCMAMPAEDINVPLRGTVVLSGIGGHTIIKILKCWQQHGVLHAKRLLLNPLTHVEELQQFLEDWPHYRERSAQHVMEGPRRREIIILDA